MIATAGTFATKMKMMVVTVALFFLVVSRPCSGARAGDDAAVPPALVRGRNQAQEGRAAPLVAPLVAPPVAWVLAPLVAGLVAPLVAGLVAPLVAPLLAPPLAPPVTLASYSLIAPLLAWLGFLLLLLLLLLLL